MTPEQELDLRMAEPEQGDVLLMRVAFPGGPNTYTYAAVGISGSWYLTGTEVEGRSWERLVNWLKTKNADVLELRRATSWEDLL